MYNIKNIALMLIFYNTYFDTNPIFLFNSLNKGIFLPHLIIEVKFFQYCQGQNLVLFLSFLAC